MGGALIGRTIQSCPSNFENVGAAESAAIRDCFRQSNIQYNLMHSFFHKGMVPIPT